VLQLEHGQPMIFGKNRDKGIRRKSDGDVEVVQIGNGITESDLIIHDAHHPLPSYASSVSHMEGRPNFPTPIGVFRAWGDVPRYEDVMNEQIQAVIAKRGPGESRQAAVALATPGKSNSSLFHHRIVLRDVLLRRRPCRLFPTLYRRYRAGPHH